MASELPDGLENVNGLHNSDVELQRPRDASLGHDLQDYEIEGRSKYPFVLNSGEMKILGE